MSTKMICPKLIIHGGAGRAIHDQAAIEIVRETLHEIVMAVYSKLESGAAAREAVIYGCQLLEDHPRFNAGRGSVLQSDGQIRMSAALMDGAAQRLSGVINVSRIKHPIDLAAFLQGQSDRILSDHGAAELARELQLPIFDPLTTRRLQEWMRERQGYFHREMASVVAETDPTEPPEPDRHGTIGVVALDSAGQLAAGTSTGGKGLERIGRVSDSAMPAGNYANADAGISCTGVGEDIIDECLAARIVVRVTDGSSLPEAMQRSFAEAHQRQRDFGAIGIDQTGAIAWGKTSEVLLSAYHTGTKVGDTLALDRSWQTGTSS
nr:isoaspartyl peptidase/L-asparaginase [Romeria gracilis]